MACSASAWAAALRSLMSVKLRTIPPTAASPRRSVAVSSIHALWPRPSATRTSVRYGVPGVALACSMMSRAAARSSGSTVLNPRAELLASPRPHQVSSEADPSTRRPSSSRMA